VASSENFPNDNSHNLEPKGERFCETALPRKSLNGKVSKRVEHKWRTSLRALRMEDSWEPLNN
jgi:hypothetical protein